MSSLSISVLILAIVAIAAVVALNLVQALGRSKRLPFSRPKPRRADREAPAADPVADPAPAPPPGAPARALAQTRAARHEPRLGEVSESNSAEQGPTMRGEDRSDRAPRSAAAPPLPNRDDDGMTEPVLEVHEGRQRVREKDGDSDGDDEAKVGTIVERGAGSAAKLPVSAPLSTSAADRPVGPRQDDSRFDAQTPAFEAGAAVLSPLCDCIVLLPLDPPVRGERLLAITQGVRRAGGKPILADGVPASAPVSDSDDSEARALGAGVAYRALRLGVLLANRHGPLNAMEYSDFVSAVQSVADQLSSLADTPDMADAIARARDLDATCAQLDAQIGLNVDSPEPLGPTQVGALAVELGLVDRGGHRHVRLGPNGELIFTMSLTGSPQRLGFLLDVPRTAEALDGFTEMASCAQDVAARLSGQLADDSGRPISDEALGTIIRQLRQRYESLDAIGMGAGSPLAMRVFN